MTEHTMDRPEADAQRLDETPLDSWKEIASYLKRDMRTVRRWEKSEGLPVHRLMHLSRASVYAYPSELDAWRAQRHPPEDEAPRVWLWHQLARGPAVAVVLLLTLINGGDSRLIGRPNTPAQAQDVVARRVWGGSGVDVTGGISPDGRWLSFVDWTTGDLAVRDLASGQTRHLTNKKWTGSWADSPEQALWSIFSPDGAQVAYAWQPNRAAYDLRVVATSEGATPRILYSSPDVGLVWPMDWSADGKQILVLSRRVGKTYQLVLVSVADGSVRVLKSFDSISPRKASLSPDGRYAAYDFRGDIFVLATDGSRETALVQHAADDAFPVWVPDGDRILFVSDRTGQPSLWAIAVSQGRPQGVPELVKADIGRLTGPMGFTRGRAFCYGLSIGMSEVFTARVDPATGTVLAPPTPVSQDFVGWIASPDWSPDGQSLAYVKRPGPGATIIIRSLATGEERELRSDATSLYRPIWSPDGRSFLVNGTNAQGRQGLLRIDAQTGATTRFVQARVYITGQAWSPDGEAAFYWDGGRLVRYTFDSGQGEPLAEVPGSPRANFAVSPDGQSLVIFRSGKALEVLSVKGGQPRELLRLQEGEQMFLYPGTAWTPDGRYVLFTKATTKDGEKAMTLWSVPAQGGEVRKFDLTMPLLRDLQMHPDGQRLAFTAGQNQYEVWVLENFLEVAASKAAGQAGRQ